MPGLPPDTLPPLPALTKVQLAGIAEQIWCRFVRGLIRNSSAIHRRLFS